MASSRAHHIGDVVVGHKRRTGPPTAPPLQPLQRLPSRQHEAQVCASMTTCASCRQAYQNAGRAANTGGAITKTVRGRSRASSRLVCHHCHMYLTAMVAGWLPSHPAYTMCERPPSSRAVWSDRLQCGAQEIYGQRRRHAGCRVSRAATLSRRIARVRFARRPHGPMEDPGAPDVRRLVGAGGVQRQRRVHGDATDRKRACDTLRAVRHRRLADVAIAITGVGEQTVDMAARTNCMQPFSIVAGCSGIQKCMAYAADDDARCMRGPGARASRLVERGLVDGGIVGVAGRSTTEMLGQLAGIGVSLRGLQSALEAQRPIDLGTPRRSGTAFSCQVPRVGRREVG